MKNIYILFSILILPLFSNSQNGWITDQQMNFKISIPNGWSKNSYVDGTDKVYDFYSADQNIAIQLRAFDAIQALTLDILVGVFEEQMLPAGTKRESLVDHVSVNGIQGKIGTYQLNYNNQRVAMGVFFAITEGKGYVLNTMIPESMIEQRGSEMKSVTESFTLLSAPQNNSQSLGGLSGMLGNLGTAPAAVPFKVTKITLCDQLQSDNRAVNSKNVFGTRTPEIHAVIEYQGYTSDAIVVRWNYSNSNRMITEDSYTFSQGQGGVGVVSLSKPTNGWPVGQYWIEFYQGKSMFKELRFDVN